MRPNINRLINIAKNFKGIKIGVVGDLIADVYVFASPERVSREAPVLIVKFEKEIVIPGSGANSAMNLCALGADVGVVGILGDDTHGAKIIDIFKENGISIDYIQIVGTTTTKTRILVAGPGRSPQQVIRIDRDPNISKVKENDIINKIIELDKKVQGWLVSDYGNGVVTEKVAKTICKISKNGKPVVVDSRYNIGFFKGMKALCPNKEEAEEFLSKKMNNKSEIIKGGREIIKNLQPEVLFITMGNKGMVVFDDTGKTEFLPVVGPEEVTDVSGAGDTVAAAILLSLCSGADAFEAGWIATCSASVVVQKIGAATLTVQELEKSIRLIDGNGKEEMK